MSKSGLVRVTLYCCKRCLENGEAQVFATDMKYLSSCDECEDSSCMVCPVHGPHSEAEDITE